MKIDHEASETTTPAISGSTPAASSPQANSKSSEADSDFRVPMTVRITRGTVREINVIVKTYQIAAAGKPGKRITMQDFVEKSLRLGLRNPELLELA